MVKKKKYRPLKKAAPLPINEEIMKLLEKMGGQREKSRLSGLWKNWSDLMGEDIADKTADIEAREKTLVLKTHDAICMQELSYQKEYILETANRFLNSPYFEKISLII